MCLQSDLSMKIVNLTIFQKNLGMSRNTSNSHMILTKSMNVNFAATKLEKELNMKRMLGITQVRIEESRKFERGSLKKIQDFA